MNVIVFVRKESFTMNDLSATLKKSRLLSPLSLETIEEKIIPYGGVHHYEKGEFIILPEDEVNDIHIILSGKVTMMHLFYNGNTNIITSLGASETVGLDLVFTRTRISPYVAEVSEQAEVFSFPASIVKDSCKFTSTEQVEFMSNALTMISHFSMQKEYRLAILSQNGLRERIMTYLTMQSARRSSKDFTIPFSREEMASFLCVNRSALSHELSLLEKEGYIKFKKNHFTLV